MIFHRTINSLVLLAVMFLNCLYAAQVERPPQLTFVCQINALGVPDFCVLKHSIQQNERANLTSGKVQSIHYVVFLDENIDVAMNKEIDRLVNLIKFGDDAKITTHIIPFNEYLDLIDKVPTWHKSIKPHVLTREGNKESFNGSFCGSKYTWFRFLCLDLIQGGDVPAELFQELKYSEFFQEYLNWTAKTPLETYIQVDTDAAALGELSNVYETIAQGIKGLPFVDQPIYSANYHEFGRNGFIEIKTINKNIDFSGRNGELDDVKGRNRFSAGLMVMMAKSLRNVLDSWAKEPSADTSTALPLKNEQAKVFKLSSLVKFVEPSLEKVKISDGDQIEEENFANRILLKWLESKGVRYRKKDGKYIRFTESAEAKFKEYINNGEYPVIYMLPYKYNSRPTAQICAQTCLNYISLAEKIQAEFPECAKTNYAMNTTRMRKIKKQFETLVTESFPEYFIEEFYDGANTMGVSQLSVLWKQAMDIFENTRRPEDQNELKDLANGNICFLHFDWMQKPLDPACLASNEYNWRIEPSVIQMYNRYWKIRQSFIENIVQQNRSLALFYLNLSNRVSENYKRPTEKHSSTWLGWNQKTNAWLSQQGFVLNEQTNRFEDLQEIG